MAAGGGTITAEVAGEAEAAEAEAEKEEEEGGEEDAAKEEEERRDVIGGLGGAGLSGRRFVHDVMLFSSFCAESGTALVLRTVTTGIEYGAGMRVRWRGMASSMVSTSTRSHSGDKRYGARREAARTRLATRRCSCSGVRQSPGPKRSSTRSCRRPAASWRVTVRGGSRRSGMRSMLSARKVEYSGGVWGRAPLLTEDEKEEEEEKEEDS